MGMITPAGGWDDPSPSPQEQRLQPRYGLPVMHQQAPFAPPVVVQVPYAPPPQTIIVQMQQRPRSVARSVLLFVFWLFLTPILLIGGPIGWAALLICVGAWIRRKLNVSPWVFWPIALLLAAVAVRLEHLGH